MSRPYDYFQWLYGLQVEAHDHASMIANSTAEYLADLVDRHMMKGAPIDEGYAAFRSHVDRIVNGEDASEFYDLDLIERALAEAGNRFGNLIQK